jgi:hypothetical protein
MPSGKCYDSPKLKNASVSAWVSGGTVDGSEIII